MEISYTYLRTKEVINTVDGRRLGRVCDVVFCYPENRVIGIVAPGGRNFFRKNEQFIDMKNIVKIGDDVVLVAISSVPKSGGRGKSCGSCVPPDHMPPLCPPDNRECNRRSYDEYE